MFRFFVPSIEVELDMDSIRDVGAEFTLSGPGLGDVVVRNTQPPVMVDADTVRYWVSGTFALPASGDTTITVSFIEGSWSYVPATPLDPTTKTPTISDHDQDDDEHDDDEHDSTITIDLLPMFSDCRMH